MLRVENEAVYCDNPDQYKDEKFGMVVAFESVMQNPNGYLDVFSEGSSALKSLLKYSWTHGIETLGCCVGHEAEHRYYKDTFFGGPKEIDEKTYLAHSNSFIYHEVKKREETPYFAFSPGKFGPKKELSKILEKSMKARCPHLNIFADYGKKLDIVTIGLTSYVPDDVREQFFRDVQDIIVREIIPLRLSEEKPSLDTQIQTASLKIELQEKQLNKKPFEYSR